MSAVIFKNTLQSPSFTSFTSFNKMKTWLTNQVNIPSLMPTTDVIQLTLTLRMTTAQVVGPSVTVNNNSPIQDFVHPDDHPCLIRPLTYKMTPGSWYDKEIMYLAVMFLTLNDQYYIQSSQSKWPKESLSQLSYSIFLFICAGHYIFYMFFLYNSVLQTCLKYYSESID